ncbi:excalibur calcium-binding domain-containing protein [Kibdelosporangium aridum]|uniref:excalibur calcium-binding domain-containing protein n=1 Tax=Kibdelosporangium aridum TaxID=2030 RepID=UPI00055E8B19
MRIIGTIALLVFASACATPTPTSAPVPISPTATSSTTSTTTTSATPTVEPVTIPLDLAGRTASKVDSELRALGFTAIKYLSPDGKEVWGDSTWTVVSVVGAGSAVRPDLVVYVKVDKPAPPPAPKTSTPPKVTPPKTQQSPPPPKAAYYKNCAAAKAAGAAPVYAGEPGYGRHLDRDGDGVGCEK